MFHKGKSINEKWTPINGNELGLKDMNPIKSQRIFHKEGKTTSK